MPWLKSNQCIKKRTEGLLPQRKMVDGGAAGFWDSRQLYKILLVHNAVLQAMQDKLVKKVSDLEGKNETLSNQLTTKDAEIQKARDEKEELKRKTDAEVSTASGIFAK